jgi:hypothetical protein
VEPDSSGVSWPPCSESDEEEELRVVVVVTPCWGVGSATNCSLLVDCLRPLDSSAVACSSSAIGCSSAEGVGSLW